MTTRYEEIPATDTSAGLADAHALVLLNAAGKLDTTLFEGDLAALEAITSNGFVVRTATNTYATRALTPPGAGLTITYPDGALGNPVFALANDLAALEGLATTGIVRRTGADTFTASNGVTLAEQASMNASKLLGRATASGAGIPQEIGLSTGLAWSSLNIIVSACPLSALATQADNTVVGNVSGGAAAPIALTQAQLTALIAAFASGTSGAVPASGGGTTNFLRADATFADPIASIPTLAHGTYTPTLTNVANAATVTASVCQYMRVGNTVTVSGKLACTFSAANTLTQIGISLPIASNFANDNECGGGGGSHITNTGLSAYIIGDTTNNRAEMRCHSTSTASRTFFFSFTYLVI